MNIANGPVRSTPANLHPPLNYCIQLTLPNDREWIAAFYDALYQLTYWFAWQRDDAHTGKDIAATWLSVLANMKQCMPLPSPDGCCDGGEPLYRQNPDNPCLFESSADGIHWCTLFDVSLCVPSTGQPGGGAEQPVPGGDPVCYHVNQQAGYQILVPTVVNAGDIITCSNFGGAANDGIPGRWDCPDGRYFFLGACQDGTQGTSGSDPMPSAPHMSVIAQISGVWYSCLSPITVPGGVSNAQVLLQLNDVTIGDNQGQYALDVCVQSNAATTFEHIFNFVASPSGWTTPPPAYGNWTAGAGWEAEIVGADTQLWIQSAIVPAFTIFEMEVIGHGTLTNFPTDRRTRINHGGETDYQLLPQPAGDFDETHTETVTGVTQLTVIFDASSYTASLSKIVALRVKGSGSDPF